MRRSVDLVNHKDEERAAELLETMHAIVHQIRARQLHEPAALAAGLTPFEAKVLSFFFRHPGATQSQLVAHSGRDKGQVARLISGLRERGLLEAAVDAEDRRVVRLTPSAAAKALHVAVKQQRRRLADMAMAGLAEGEREQLQDLLARVLANLAKSHGA